MIIAGPNFGPDFVFTVCFMCIYVLTHVFPELEAILKTPVMYIKRSEGVT